MSNLREELLTTGFGRYSGTFASGVEANNKLNLDGVQRNMRLRREVVAGIGQIIQDNNLEFGLVMPVPNGANWLGLEVASANNARYLPLRKAGNRQISLISPQDQGEIDVADKIVVVEDVPNGLTSVRRVLGLPGVMERTVAVLGVFDRGDPSQREPLPEHILLRSLVEEYIPPMLPDDSNLWKYAV